MTINVTKLQQQFKFLAHLQRLSQSKLLALHDKVFRGTKWFMQIPRAAHREFVVRRLWFYYCVRNYHYPEGKVREAFRARARKVLAEPYDPAKHSVEEMAKQQATDYRRFSRVNIKAMPINEVDRHLAILGIYAELEPWKRKRLLWEYYNRPTEKMKRHRKANRLNNRYYLSDLILKHTTMSYDQFMSVYGNEMPTVTRASFNNARCRLRASGYQIPKLRTGPSNPAIVNLDGKALRGRHEEADPEAEKTEPS